MNKLNYHKNTLINRCLSEYYNTFSLTLDTADFVPNKYNDKIRKYIFKCMKKHLRLLDKADKRYQREQRRKQRKRCRSSPPLSRDSVVEVPAESVTSVTESEKSVNQVPTSEFAELFDATPDNAAELPDITVGSKDISDEKSETLPTSPAP